MNATGFAMPPDYWLPAPDRPFALALRIYWPGPAALDGTWTPPPVLRKG